MKSGKKRSAMEEWKQNKSSLKPDEKMIKDFI